MFRIFILFAIIFSISSPPVPTTFDWRSKGAILPVQTQGPCKKDVIINALDSIASVNMIKSQSKQVIPLSAQQIYDCGNYTFCPCNYTGNVSETLMLIWEQQARTSYMIDSEESYPLTTQCTHKCRFNASTGSAIYSGFLDSMWNQWEDYIYPILMGGPVIAYVEANTAFQTYTGGVFDDPDCKGSHLNHTLLIVGYDNENGVDYWIARNSWGTKWGEQGYIRIMRNKNMCGLGYWFAQPLMDIIH